MIADKWTILFRKKLIAFSLMARFRYIAVEIIVLFQFDFIFYSDSQLLCSSQSKSCRKQSQRVADNNIAQPIVSGITRWKPNTLTSFCRIQVC